MLHISRAFCINNTKQIEPNSTTQRITFSSSSYWLFFSIKCSSSSSANFSLFTKSVVFIFSSLIENNRKFALLISPSKRHFSSFNFWISVCNLSLKSKIHISRHMRYNSRKWLKKPKIRAVNTVTVTMHIPNLNSLHHVPQFSRMQHTYQSGKWKSLVCTLNSQWKCTKQFLYYNAITVLTYSFLS